MGSASRSASVVALALVLVACGSESDAPPPAPLPPPIGKYVAYIARDAEGVERLYVVDSGVPGVAHEMNAPLGINERVDRFVASPDGQRIAYVTYASNHNREDLYFTSLATPQRAERLRLYPDQGVAKVAFTADSQRYAALLAHRGATPPVQLPPGLLIVGDPDDLSTGFTLPHTTFTAQDDTTNFVLSPDGQFAVFNGSSGLFRMPVGSLPPAMDPSATFSGPFSVDGGFFGFSRDGTQLVANHFSLYAGPADASAPTVEIVDGCCGAGQVNGFAMTDDAADFVFVLDNTGVTPDELRITSLSTPGASTLVTLPDPDHRVWSGPVMLPGTTDYAVWLVDPTQAGTAAWIGLYTGDAATGATPTLLGAANEAALDITALDADELLYFGSPASGGATQLRQVNLAAPGTLIDLASPLSGPSGISVCGSTVAFATVGVPYGVWVATVGQANSGSMILATTNNSPSQVTCLP